MEPREPHVQKTFDSSLLVTYIRRMVLEQWMRKAGLSEPEVAEALQCSRETINRYKNRVLCPSGPRMIQIYELTGGRVTPSDLKTAT